jgi:general secretion pathway protein A
MDLLSYFKLSEHPFRISPDPRYLYFSDQVKEAIAKCEFMAQERIGPVYLYGLIGCGKTSMLRRLYDRLSQHENYNVALLISPNIKSSNSFLRVIMETFEVKTERAYDQSLKNFEQFLVEQNKAGITPILLVDEAQNMNRDTLKLLHYLLNFETNSFKLLQIVLAGQEELSQKILRYKELASRMFPVAINAMSPTDLEQMLQYRWTVAGGKKVPFDENDSEIYKTLFAYSKGLPRDAIKVCDEVLRELAFSSRHQATYEDIEKIAIELNLKS